MMEDVQRHSVHTLVFRSLKRSHDMFLSNQGILPTVDETAFKLRKAVKARDSYGQVFDDVKKMQAMKHIRDTEAGPNPPPPGTAEVEASTVSEGAVVPYTDTSLMTRNSTNTQQNQLANIVKKVPTMPKPKWHAPWKLYRVIAGHLGWVRCVAVEPGNEWFATGAADRIIKIWDLASGQLKVSLTGHVSTVRGLAVSSRHPYLFSCGEDRQVKCWDLEYNKVTHIYNILVIIKHLYVL